MMHAFDNSNYQHVYSYLPFANVLDFLISSECLTGPVQFVETKAMFVVVVVQNYLQYE